MEVYTKTGKKLSLQEPEVKSGGEGAIYTVSGCKELVVKIYKSKADAKEREAKIREMANLSADVNFKNTGILNYIAWPLAPLYDKNKEFVGFGMVRINAQYELDDIYSKSSVTGAGMSTYERITVLISLCQVVERLHKCGQVFGDFNPNNIKIDKQCNVKFVDADSYHFRFGNKLYPCVVCATGYVAPELITKCKGTTYADYKGTTFTKETDLFALAIHCFRMLMNGCHPYTCKKHAKVGSTPAPSLEDRVEKGETPFFTNIPDYGTPDWAPDSSSLPDYICTLFKRAFVEGHTNPSARPDANEWKQAMVKYRAEIVKCKADAKHYYWKKLKGCPYCEADERGKRAWDEAVREAKLLTQAQAQFPAQSTIQNAMQPLNYATGNANFGNVSPCNVRVRKKAGGKNAVLYWLITMLFSLALQGGLAFYAYQPLYMEFGGPEWLTWVGIVGSAVSGIIGSIVYGIYWSAAENRPPYKFRWYDYILSTLAGMGFVVGFGSAFVVLIFVTVLAVSVLAAIVALYIMGAIIVGICSNA